MAKTGHSAIAKAAKATPSVDIPQARGHRGAKGRDNFTAVAAKSLPAKNGAQPLPTPPNSISPSLPPHAFRSAGMVLQDRASPPAQVDSDIDLHDGAANSGDSVTQAQHGFDVLSPNDGVTANDVAGAITPALLATHHLPEILLAHGPLAIRHVMGYLTTSVPGFSRIPPAKARRLVVGALEGRGSGAEEAGSEGNVIFEKVGWGRWDARLKGHPPREPHPMNPNNLTVSPPPSMPSSYSGLSAGGVPSVPTNFSRWPDRGNKGRPGTSWAGDSAVFSHDEDMDLTYPEDLTMLEHEADKMSLDGDHDAGLCSSSSEEVLEDDELGDATDDEDWAAIGAAALRQGFSRANKSTPTAFSSSVNATNRLHHQIQNITSLPNRGHKFSTKHINHIDGSAGVMDPSGIASDSQEREAIEALVSLRSV